MSYYYTTEPGNAVPPNSFASPKTQTPGAPVKERDYHLTITDAARPTVLATKYPRVHRKPHGGPKTNWVLSTKYTDSETGLIYYGYRNYQPETGRWCSRDPLGEWGGINLFSFVHNNPPNLHDSKGLSISTFLQNKCCSDKCRPGETRYAIEWKIIPETYDPSRGDSSSTGLERVELLQEIAQFIATAGTTVLSAAIIENLLSRFAYLGLSASDILDMAREAQKNASGAWSGWSLYTKVKYRHCRSTSCFVFWRQYDWGAWLTSDWKACRIGSLSSEGPVNPSTYTYQDRTDALRNLGACMRAHQQEVERQLDDESGTSASQGL